MAPFAAPPARPTSPAMLARLMMLPLPLAAIAGAKAATSRYGARTLESNSASKPFRVKVDGTPEPGEPCIVHEDVNVTGFLDELSAHVATLFLNSMSELSQRNVDPWKARPSPIGGPSSCPTQG